MAHFVRIPPDSTGKRIRHDGITEITYTNPTGLLSNLDKGNVIIGALSGVSGNFKSFENENGETVLYLDDVTGNFTSGELLLHNSQTVCEFVSQIEIYTQKNQIIDGFNPEHSLTIDKYGSAYVRYREGEQLFDSFGNAQVSVTHKIADFVFTYTSHDESFYTEASGGGYMTHSSIQSINKLIVDNFSGSYVFRESIINYPYVPGHGTFLSVSLSCGDNGKEGVVRRWGLYDADDGCYFELDGMTFSVNIKSTTTGTQSIETESLNFNGNLDYSLDFSKFNLFWIDFQWQGVGRVRFGAFGSDGSRVVIHTFQHANNIIVPYMKRGTLPFRYEIINKTTTASSSELNVTCVSIGRQGGEDGLLTSGKNWGYTSPERQVGASFVPIISAKPKITFNGITNRVISIPSQIQVYSTEPIVLDCFVLGSLTGSTFSIDLGGSILIDNVATSISGGMSLGANLVGSGVSRIDFDEALNYTLALYPNLFQPYISFSAKSLSGSTASVVMLMNWREIY
jgi:hypothetical protein